jgi:ABC-type glutathione transport system ATPase component
MATLEITAAGTLAEAPAAAGRRPAVEVRHLRKTYGTLVAVDDVSFTVTEGEIFGILGPNGAGKTTAIECAVGLRRPDAGTIRLLGLDPHADRDKIHEIVGVQLQAGALPAKLRVGEILQEYRSFYRDPADVGELLDVLGLCQRTGRWVNWSAPHSGQCRYTSAGWLPAAIAAFSRSISARSRLDRPATEIMLIDVTRRRAADLGTRQV